MVNILALIRLRITQEHHRLCPETRHSLAWTNKYMKVHALSTMKLNHYGIECNVTVTSKFTVPCINLFKHALCMCVHMYANNASELNSGLIHSAV